MRRRVAIPEPRDDDLEDVHWALSAAIAMYERGDTAEALKWLRRAAGTAADRDADVRAVELFKAAADMASIVDAQEAAEGTAPTPKKHSRAKAVRDVPDPPTKRREPRNLVPEVPPPARVSERFRALGLHFDENEEDTFVRPETMLRRALLAIDPDYARRTDYDDDGVGEAPSARPVHNHRESRKIADTRSDSEVESDGDWAADDEDSDPPDETIRRRSVSDSAAPSMTGPVSPRASAGPMPGGLLTVRVAVLPIPEDGDVRLIFLSPGEEPPPGVATALLVPPSQEDAELLAKLYADSAAKL